MKIFLGLCEFFVPYLFIFYVQFKKKIIVRSLTGVVLFCFYQGFVVFGCLGIDPVVEDKPKTSYLVRRSIDGSRGR